MLLAIALVPVGFAYAWQTLFRPIAFPDARPVDFFEDYVATAKLLAAGGDPYTTCLSKACWLDLTSAWSVYPPVVSWLSLPLAHLDPTISGIGALVAAQLCVGVFIWMMARALHIHDWQVISLWVLAAIAFPPLIGEVIERNLQVLLLALSAIWFAAWLDGDRWWGGVALGFGLGLKLVQAPLVLLGLWFRRFKSTLAVMLCFGVLWLVGAPQYLGEYLFKVLPGLNTGTGAPMDVAPVAMVARLIHPGSMYGYGTGIDTTVRLVGYAIALAVIALTVIVLRSPRADRDGRGLEAALAVAATPLLLAVVRPGHLLLLLLPMLVLGTTALRRRNLGLGIAVAVSWILIGPTYLWVSNLLSEGVGAQFLRLGEESALAGTVILWLAALQALRQHRDVAPEMQAAPSPMFERPSLVTSRL